LLRNRRTATHDERGNYKTEHQFLAHNPPLRQYHLFLRYLAAFEKIVAETGSPKELKKAIVTFLF
jgi:hypothetical protein